MPSWDLDYTQFRLSLLTSGALVTSGTAIQMTAGLLILRKSVGSAATVALPTNPLAFFQYVIKDGKGDASTNNITVTSPLNIDGASTYVINVNYSSNSFVFDTVTWNAV